MITLNEIRKEVLEKTELLKKVRTIEDAINLQDYGYTICDFGIDVDGDCMALEDAVAFYSDWDTEISGICIDDVYTKRGISYLHYNRDDETVTFAVFDEAYDREHDMLDCVNLETLEEEFKCIIEHYTE